MSQIFGFIYAVMKAVPIVKKWVDQFIAWRISEAIDDMHEDDRKAIRKAIDEKDQRDLEKQIGNPNPGEPSNLPGVIIRDGMPHPK